MGLLDRLGLARRSQVLALQHSLERMRKFEKKSSGTPMGWDRFEYEANQKLTGAAKWDTLDQMENDPHVKGALRANTFPLLDAEWSIEPGGEDERDQEIADFVSANLLRTTSDKFGREYWCATPWRQRLSEILQFLHHGFSVFAFTFRRVGGKIVYDEIKWLEPSSIDPRGWELDDNDNLVRLKRTFSTPEQRFLHMDPIEAEQIALYVWEFKGARLEGRMLTRSMYGAWVRKDYKLRQSAIWAQKAGAPSPMGDYPPNWPKELIPMFHEFVRSQRGEAPGESYFVGPQSPDGKSAAVHFAGAAANLDRGMTEVVGMENLEISHAAGTKSEMLGETNSGSRAVAEPMGKREMSVIQAIAGVVCELENHGLARMPGVIERLVDLNFSNVKHYPVLRCADFDPLGDMDALATAYEKGLIPKHPAVQKQVTQRFKIELTDDQWDEIEQEAEERKNQIPPVPSPTSQPANLPPGDSSEEGGRGNQEPIAAVALESVSDFQKRIAPLLEPIREGRPSAGGFRHPNRLEAEVVTLATVDDAFRVGESVALTSLREISRSMVGDLMRRLRSGKISARSIDSQRRSKFRGQKRAEADLGRGFESTGRVGVEHVVEELK